MASSTVDAHEETLLLGAAHELGVESEMVTAQIADFTSQAGSFVPLPGMRLCFNGSATAADGSKLPRSVLEGLAIELGLEPVKNVSKSGYGLLAAANPTFQSGKAKKAETSVFRLLRQLISMCCSQAHRSPRCRSS